DGTEPAKMELCVSNGGGIAAELLPHIFDPFRSGRPRGSSGDGLGIGLYIVREIAQAHGGDVTVLSSEAGPTTFRVELPRQNP
ncbi:MAG: ATP-binding protein, partial [Pseudomonadota bacterium]|nr:ATP-binding protein [Pseudomonadota bacterium]